MTGKRAKSMGGEVTLFFAKELPGVTWGDAPGRLHYLLFRFALGQRLILGGKAQQIVGDIRVIPVQIATDKAD